MQKTQSIQIFTENTQIYVLSPNFNTNTHKREKTQYLNKSQQENRASDTLHIRTVHYAYNMHEFNVNSLKSHQNLERFTQKM